MPPLYVDDDEDDDENDMLTQEEQEQSRMIKEQFKKEQNSLMNSLQRRWQFASLPTNIRYVNTSLFAVSINLMKDPPQTCPKFIASNMSAAMVKCVLLSHFPDLHNNLDWVETEEITGEVFQSLTCSDLATVNIPIGFRHALLSLKETNPSRLSGKDMRAAFQVS